MSLESKKQKIDAMQKSVEGLQEKKMSKENPQDARKKTKRFLSQSNEEMPDIYIKNSRFVEKQKIRASSCECFATSGFVCVRGFDQKEHAPRPLQARLHFTASRLAKRGK
ncbi:hypothetical protein ACSQ67_014406 [Phaseolus vulgaris]